jgi:hypothetical protein
MKMFLGVSAFVLLFSVPAHAQMRGTGQSASPMSRFNGGGGGTGGGSIGGTNAAGIPNYQRATFNMSEVSGGDPSFAPSTFRSFEQAVAEGKAILADDQKSLGQIAAENNTRQKATAKFAFVQDANGNAVLAARR